MRLRAAKNSCRFVNREHVGAGRLASIAAVTGLRPHSDWPGTSLCVRLMAPGPYRVRGCRVFAHIKKILGSYSRLSSTLARLVAITKAAIPSMRSRLLDL